MTYLPGRLIDGSRCRLGAHGAVTLRTYHELQVHWTLAATEYIMLCNIVCCIDNLSAEHLFWGGLYGRRWRGALRHTLERIAARLPYRRHRQWKEMEGFRHRIPNLVLYARRR